MIIHKPALTVALVLVAASALCAEIRTIDGIQVNLQPLIDWSAKKEGERPLKHWKSVKVLELKRQSMFPEVSCEIEGATKEIMLKNCPKSLLDLFDQKKKLDAEIATIKQAENSADQAAQHARNRWQVAASKRAQQADAREEKSVQKDLNEVTKKIGQQQNVWAMATGRTLGGLPVWDTGLQGR